MGDNLIFESLKFMTLGMATVFIFLIFMIYILKLQTYIIQKFFSEEKSSLKDSKIPKNEPILDDDTQIVSVIVAAIADYKKNSKGS